MSKSPKRTGDASVPCPKCTSNSEVLETRAAAYGTRRRRRCTQLSCMHLFTTAEIVAPWPDNAKPAAVRIVAIEDLRTLNEVVDRLGRERSR
jgi:hypothetical protein